MSRGKAIVRHKAKPMFSDPSLAELMKKAGVLDQPTVFFLEEVETSAL